jgi:hypothetical protein
MPSWVAGIRDKYEWFFCVLSVNVTRSWAACTCASKLSQFLLRASRNDVQDLRAVPGELPATARRPADTR